jgi:iron complex outermembrane recepter protein
MRGVGNFTLVANSDPAIAFNYDGVYVGRPTGSTGVFYDLARVEILKGPQGILYGRNATGGAINILPVQPKIGELSGYLSGTYGNYETVNAEGAVNVPIGDRGAMRLSLSTANHDGYLRDGMQDEKTVAGRLQIKAELTPDLTIRVAGDYAHNGGKGNSVSYFGRYGRNVTAPVVAGPVPGTNYYTFIPTTLDPSEGIFSPASQAYRTSTPFGPFGRLLDAYGPAAKVDNSFYGFNAEISWDVGPGTITLIPAWRYADLDYNAAAAAFAYDNVESAEQYSLEARFAGERIGIFDYTLGGYYYDERIDSLTSLSISNTGSFIDQTLTTTSYAAFGRLTANVSDRFRIVGGVRYTHDKKGFDYAATGAVINCLARNAFGAPACPTAPFVPLFNQSLQLPFAFPAFGGAPIPVFTSPGPPNYLIIRTDTFFDRSLSSSRVTYRGAVEFDVAPQSLLYASVESGYRSGGFSAAAGFETYQPEYITAYTIGMKNRFLNNRVQLNIEGFIWDYTNQQVNFVGLDINGRTANRTQNVGASKIKGVEVEGRFLITPTTLLSADVQYLDAKQKEYTYSAGAGNPPLTGCQVSFNAAATGTTPPYTIDCAGNQSYNSPKWTMNLAAQQTLPIGDYELVLGADTQYKSSRNLGFAYLPQQRIGSTWTSNAQVSFGAADQSWSIAAYVRNIENERIQLFNSTHPTALFLTAGQSAPRTYGVRGSFKF